jgi:hypothetical protein
VFALFRIVILNADVLCWVERSAQLSGSVAVSAGCRHPSLEALGFAKDSPASRMTGRGGVG